MVDSSEIMRASHRERLAGQIDWLETFPRDFASILDVGAGSGAHCEFFKDRGYNPTAIDTQPDWFGSHGSIEFIQGNVLDLDGSRKFDAIFSSHTLEHIPNTEIAMQKMRALINDGGYLFIVVPPYSPLTANDHWHTGWNCAQLAMWLVANGFDCSEANFVERDGNVCGWGKRTDIPATNFNIPASLPFLPKGLAAAKFRMEENDHLPDNIGFDRNGLILRASPREKILKLRHQRKLLQVIAAVEAMLLITVAMLVLRRW
jgi:SAM-dependent methyltransferase